MITVVDYGIGNIAAILNMLDYLGFEAESSEVPDCVAAAEKLILPGVGAFDRAMLALHRDGLIAPLEEAVLARRVPVLGVCLGMQLLARRSEEGQEPGLGWIAADVVRLGVTSDSDLKVPHIGWADVDVDHVSPLFPSLERRERFYFDHGYHMVCDDPNEIAATIRYGVHLCCAVSSGNIHGVQFHPEKSHRFGMRLLRSFAEI